MIVRILEITLPIFAIVFAGFVYGRFTKPNMVGANKIIMDLALPCLVFTSLSAKKFDFYGHSTFLLGITSIIILSGLLTIPFARFLGTGKKALLPSVMFVNVGPIGIPLVVLAFGQDYLGLAILFMVLSNVYHFSIGVSLMSGKLDIKLLATNPLILSSVLGILFSFYNFIFPSWLNVSLTMIGSILVPLMLLSLGIRLAESKVEYLKVGLLGSIWTFIIRISVVLVITQFLELDPVQKGTLILFAALPSAIFNYMIADRFNCEPNKVASIVIVGHILCLIFLPIAIWLALI
ncbi:MAG: AEC family transporter [Pelagibacteraceae bacterium]|jgi:predicted permease